MLSYYKLYLRKLNRSQPRQLKINLNTGLKYKDIIARTDYEDAIPMTPPATREPEFPVLNEYS